MAPVSIPHLVKPCMASKSTRETAPLLVAPEELVQSSCCFVAEAEPCEESSEQSSWKIVATSYAAIVTVVLLVAWRSASPYAAAEAAASARAAVEPQALQEIVVMEESRSCSGVSLPCVGGIDVGGYGRLWLLQAGANTPAKPSTAPASVMNCNVLQVPMTGRVYGGDRCPGGPFYWPGLYANMMFLGKAFSFTVDLSAADCGCVVAMYLVSMNHNHARGLCKGDYYCDANSVCGVACTEYDVMEANKHVFRSTAHAADDPGGQAAGLGRGIAGLDWDKYHPGSDCIDTNLPFQVSVHFPPGDTMAIALAQRGHDCQPQIFSVKYPGIDEALSEGMTPVFSYWHSSDTAWFDGPGWNPTAPSFCSLEDYGRCGEMAFFAEMSLDTLDSDGLQGIM